MCSKDEYQHDNVHHHQHHHNNNHSPAADQLHNQHNDFDLHEYHNLDQHNDHDHHKHHDLDEYQHDNALSVDNNDNALSVDNNDNALSVSRDVLLHMGQLSRAILPPL